MANLELLTNIWGLKGCLRPDGKLCTVCCTEKAIISNWGNKTFIKFPGKNCSFQTIGDGCKVNGVAPDACENYHCSQEPPEMQEKLRQTELRNFPCL